MLKMVLGEAKEHLGEVIEDSNSKLRLFFIKDEETSQRSWVIGERLVKALFAGFSCSAELEKEHCLGFWTAYVPELDLWGRGDTREEAEEDLLSAALDYVEVFLENLPFYIGAGRKKHLPYICNLLLVMDSKNKMRKLLGLA
jgi:hypothetical protein